MRKTPINPNWETLYKIPYKYLLWTEFCPPKNSYFEALTSTVTFSGDRVFEKLLGLNEVIRVGSLSHWLWTFKKRKRYLSPQCVRTQLECSCLRAKKRALIMIWTCWNLDLRLSSFHNCEKVNICYLSHPVYGSLLWQY